MVVLQSSELTKQTPKWTLFAEYSVAINWLCNFILNISSTYLVADYVSSVFSLHNKKRNLDSYLDSIQIYTYIQIHKTELTNVVLSISRSVQPSQPCIILFLPRFPCLFILDSFPSSQTLPVKNTGEKMRGRNGGEQNLFSEELGPLSEAPPSKE